MLQRLPLSRELIVQTALELVDRGSAERPAIRAVAKELGVSAPSLYYYFSSQEQLEQATAYAATALLLRSMPYSPTRLAWDKEYRVDRSQLHRFAAAYLRFAGEHQSLYRLICVPTLTTTAHVALPRGEGRLWHQLLSLVSKYTGDPDDFESTLAFWALLHGYATLERARNKRLDELNRYLRVGLNALLDGLSVASNLTLEADE